MHPTSEHALQSLSRAKSARRRQALGEIDPLRPTVHIVPGELPRMVDESEAALNESNQGFYQRGGMLVRPYRDSMPAANGRTTEFIRLGRPSITQIRECLAREANYVKYDARSSDFVRSDCPLDVAASVHAREGQWSFPRLRAVITTPILRHDGSVLDKPGYDAATGLLYDPGGTRFPPIPLSPTKDDARTALAMLTSLIAEYPFADPESRAVAASGMITAVVRRSLPTAPVHAVNARAPGTGKTHLVDLCSMLAVGQLAAIISQASNDEETEKRIAATQIAADPILNIDNCNRPLGGGLLCVIVTQNSVKVRVLGSSQNVEVPCDSAIFATGNNLSIGDDMSRRVLICMLDARAERPELREFRADPIAAVRRARGKYVAAVLTILRAFHVAGRPELRPPLGSFAEWSLLVRNALLWLGEVDPVATMEQARAADTKLQALATVIDQWSGIPVLMERKKTASEIIAVASEEELGADGKLRSRYGDFRDALLAVAAEGHASISTRRLGKWLLANQGRVLNGRQIVQIGQRGGVALWRLELVESP